ncbi:MAG: hypothetical protein HC837_14015 [Chloroflexaceae bacterium]|nr:hypothetical protein [Chloroflexaceae bacterium]
MALAMVAGAVIISSHTSSTRAANLLASFILIPMTIVIQIQSIFFIAGRWDIVFLFIVALMVVAIALVRTGIAAFDREEILSREHEKINLSAMINTFKTFFA